MALPRQTRGWAQLNVLVEQTVRHRQVAVGYPVSSACSVIANSVSNVSFHLYVL